MAVGFLLKGGKELIKHLALAWGQDLVCYETYKEIVDACKKQDWHPVFALGTEDALTYYRGRAVNIIDYKHPERACYIIGDNSSNDSMHKLIEGLEGDIVYIQLPTPRFFHDNTALATILYDREIKNVRARTF